MDGEDRQYKLCLFVHSGSYDKVYQALSLANTTLAKGGEVHALFAYGALKRLVRGKTDDLVVEGEPAPFFEELRKNIERGSMEKISDLIDMGKRFGRLKLYACSGSMAILNITRDELIDEVDTVTGLVRFTEIAMDADLALYI